jgi:hypothetical protein
MLSPGIVTSTPSSGFGFTESPKTVPVNVALGGNAGSMYNSARASRRFAGTVATNGSDEPESVPARTATVLPTGTPQKRKLPLPSAFTSRERVSPFAPSTHSAITVALETADESASRRRTLPITIPGSARFAVSILQIDVATRSALGTWSRICTPVSITTSGITTRVFTESREVVWTSTV